MPSDEQQKMQALCQALHRKLKNLSQDIRLARKNGEPTDELKARRKRVDMAYSRAMLLQTQPNDDGLRSAYSELHAIYNHN